MRLFPDRVGLQRWLLVLAMVSMLPVLLFAGLIVQEYRHSTREYILQDLVDRTRGKSIEVERVLQATSMALGALAESGSARAGDWRGLHEDARHFVERETTLRAITLVDRDGRLVFYTGAPFDAPGFPIGDPASVEQVFKTGRPHVSSAFRVPVAPMPKVAVSVPVKLDGQVRFVLRGILRTETFDDMLAARDMPAGWVLGITDHEGVLLARSLHSERYVGRPAAPVFLEAMRRGDGRPLAGRTLDGVASTTLVLPVFGGDWHVGVAVADEVLDAAWVATLHKLGLLAVVWLALAIVLARVYAGFLLVQVRVLVASANAPDAQQRPRSGLMIREFETVLDGIEDTRQRADLAQTQKNEAISQREQVFDLYERAPCGYHSLDRQGRVLRMNETQLKWLGYRLEELIGRPYSDLLTEESRAIFKRSFPVFLERGHVENLEFDLVRKDGSLLPVSVSGTAIRDDAGEVVASRSTVFDLTERKRLEAQLEQLALTDALTGLGNRREFEAQSLREFQRARRLERPLACLLLDIDHFKQVNDRHGHAAGDQVLQGLAQRWRAQMRDIDLLARIGGEEFACLLPETAVEQAVEIAERLRSHVQDWHLDLPTGEKLGVTVSIGVATRAADDEDMTGILARADRALYAAKRAGRNRVSLQASTAERAAHEPDEPDERLPSAS